MINNEVDTRFRTFLRTCFLVEVIEGLKTIGILAPWNYVRYYYSMIDAVNISSLVSWLVGTAVVGGVLFVVFLFSVMFLVELSLIAPTMFTFWITTKGICVISPMITMHSWYRHWKREVIK